MGRGAVLRGVGHANDTTDIRQVIAIVNFLVHLTNPHIKTQTVSIAVIRSPSYVQLLIIPDLPSPRRNDQGANRRRDMEFEQMELEFFTELVKREILARPQAAPLLCTKVSRWSVGG